MPVALGVRMKIPHLSLNSTGGLIVNINLYCISNYIPFKKCYIGIDLDPGPCEKLHDRIKFDIEIIY